MTLPALPSEFLAVPVSALELRLEHEAVPAEQVVAGSPTTGYRVLGEIGGAELGVWEMTAGATRDVEVDEVFVVLAGSATVAFDDGRAPLELAPGTVARLAEGDATVWTVRETLRKLVLS
ncbi:MAG: cupin domain-containing protein [Actinomycetales bacterium]|nr:cupin domain-containing protein [Actinomycetales bacterium]